VPSNLTEVEVSKALETFFQPDQEGVYASGYYQFKGTLYRTKYLDFKGSLSFREDELRNLVESFEEKYAEDEDALEVLEAPKVRDLLAQAKEIDDFDTKMSLLGESFPVSQLSKAVVEYATNVCLFWCSSCKNMYFEREVQTDWSFKYPKCPSCGRQLQQTPVWVMKTDNDRKPQPVTPFTVWIPSMMDEGWSAWKQRRHMRCRECNSGLLRQYVILDKARIMASARIVCDNCHKQYSLFSRNYSLTAATANLTKPLMAQTYSGGSIGIRRQNLLSKISDKNVLDPDQVDEFSFAPSIRVKEVLLGFRYGLHVVRTYKAKRSGIALTTGGIYIRLKDTYFPKALEFMKISYQEHTEYPARLNAIDSASRDFRHLVLHSIGHSLMSGLPQTTGVSIDSFGYLYDFAKNAVLVYERAPGGLGACSVLTADDEESGDPILLDYLSRLREALASCTCDDRCKYCVALVGCDEFNRNLNRFSLGPLFGIEPDDMTWGF
jgi:hypothetical protein